MNKLQKKEKTKITVGYSACVYNLAVGIGWKKERSTYEYYDTLSLSVKDSQLNICYF